jgi:hypothetical protein
MYLIRMILADKLRGLLYFLKRAQTPHLCFVPLRIILSARMQTGAANTDAPPDLLCNGTAFVASTVLERPVISTADRYFRTHDNPEYSPAGISQSVSAFKPIYIPLVCTFLRMHRNAYRYRSL